MVDVDGYFPIDQASDGSEAKQIISRHLESLGLSNYLALFRFMMYSAVPL